MSTYVFDPPEILYKSFEPYVYHNWHLNDCLTKSFLLLGLSESEHNLADDSISAWAMWEYLQAWHGGAGPV